MRHGVCYAFLILSTKPDLLSEIDVVTIQKMFEVLKNQVELQDKDINAYNANAVAGQAITKLLITIKTDVTLSMKFLSFGKDMDEYVHPVILFMFKQPQAQLLDSAGVCFMLLMNKLPKLMKVNTLTHNRTKKST